MKDWRRVVSRPMAFHSGRTSRRQPVARRATILLVEDDRHDVELLELAIARAKASFCLVAVNNGHEAIQYLAGAGDFADRKKFPEPALVLLDLTMPGLSGFDVLRWMRMQPAGTMPPVVVLSYSRLEHERRLALELGAKQFVIKSVDLDGSVEMVRQLVQAWGLVPPESTEERR